MSVTHLFRCDAAFRNACVPLRGAGSRTGDTPGVADDSVEKRWAASEAGFEELMKEPWRSYRGSDQLSSLPLIYFKVCLCQIRTKQDARAGATCRELKTLSDAQAAGAAEAVLLAPDFEQGKTAAARQRLETLRKNSAAKEVALYEDGFVELGWLNFISDTGKSPASKRLPPLSSSQR